LKRTNKQRSRKSTLLQTLGRQLRQSRVAKGISQERLAEEADLHRTYISSVERGERNVSVNNLNRICAALSIKISALFLGMESNLDKSKERNV
jgi:transcriptional regulator with XRE-family HTH domain